MEFLHVIPWLVDEMREVKEQRCGGLWNLDDPSGNVTKAWGRPIQWTVRRTEEDQPSGSGA